jgi:alkylhydroperoxidase/carboxymuconolactone decarboxylase family protein YurZ
MSNYGRPPKTYQQFVKRYPKLEEAWSSINEAGSDGPIDERTARLIKLGIAIGAMREGAVHSSVRKAIALGISPEEIEQVVALSAGALGLPSVVAAFTWVHDILDRPGREEQAQKA